MTQPLREIWKVKIYFENLKKKQSRIIKKYVIIILNIFTPAFVQALQNKKPSEDKKEEEDMALD